MTCWMCDEPYSACLGSCEIDGKTFILCRNCHAKVSTFTRTLVLKGWGHENWLQNNDKYCGKKLFVKKDKRCSWHFHNLKTETFCLDSGEILLRYGETDDISLATEIVMRPGDTFHIPTGLRHQFEGIINSVIIEISTTHFDEDSIRVIKGD